MDNPEKIVTETLKMQSQGRLTIKKTVREYLDLKQGDFVIITIRKVSV